MTTNANRSSNSGYTSRFAQIPSANIPRSVFNRSHGLKTAFRSGFLIPVLTDEVLPGDTVNCRMTQFTRMTTALLPVMENMYIDTFFFFVPNRLLFENWQRMMGEQDNPDDSVDFELPIMNSGTGYVEESLSDYLGLPIGVSNMEHHALFHRAYALIYNQWFRSEDLIDSVPFSKGPGPDDPADYPLQRRGKRHDYFTSCLPWPTKGGTGVELPLGTSAPVVGIGDPTFDVGNQTGVNLAFEGAPNNSASWSATGTNDTSATWNDPQLQTDLTSAAGATINMIREAFAVQRLFERDARGGTRYTEICRSHFQVISPDQRLQRPEYLGGGSTRISVNPVAQTFGSGGGFALGELGAYATASGQAGFSKSFVEHGVILGLAMVRADLNYQQGLNKMFTRRDRLDFFWPALQHLGEQEVLTSELFAETGAGSVSDTTVFGYQERYAEYRYKQGQITGKLRSTAATPLHNWHLAQEFASAPLLNQEFIEEDAPFDRILTITEDTEPGFRMDAWYDYKHARPMPTYGVPGLIDHF